MSLFATTVYVLAGAAVFATFVYVAVLLVRYAKGRSAGAYSLGAVLILFGLGNVQDPSNQALAQAQSLKKKEEDDSGDPPNE